MDSLPERIEAAEGPSRELDAEIASASGWVHRSGKPWAQVVEWERPAYSALIDDAMTLVPSGAKLQFQNFGDVGGRCMWLVEPNERYVSAATPALALCAAALRAKEQPNEG